MQDQALLFGVLTPVEFMGLLTTLGAGVAWLVERLAKLRERERAHELAMAKLEVERQRDLLSEAILDAGDRAQPVKDQVALKATPTERDQLDEVKKNTARRKSLT